MLPFLVWRHCPLIGLPLGVSENSGFSPKSSILIRVFQYFHHPFWGKHQYFWKHPCMLVCWGYTNHRRVKDRGASATIGSETAMGFVSWIPWIPKFRRSCAKDQIGRLTRRIVPFSKWLITMVIVRSPNMGLFQMAFSWLVNAGY